jgi:hypothetical protein
MASAPSHRWLRAMSGAASAQRTYLPHNSFEWHVPIRHHIGSGTIASHPSTRRPWGNGRHTIARNQQELLTTSTTTLRRHSRTSWTTTTLTQGSARRIRRSGALERAYAAHDVSVAVSQRRSTFRQPALRPALRRSHKTHEIPPVTCLALLLSSKMATMS